MQGLRGASLCESEAVQPRLSDPDQGMFRRPGSSLGQIRWVWLPVYLEVAQPGAEAVNCCVPGLASSGANH